MAKAANKPINQGGQTQNRTVDTRIFNPSRTVSKAVDNQKKLQGGTIAGQDAAINWNLFALAVAAMGASAGAEVWP